MNISSLTVALHFLRSVIFRWLRIHYQKEDKGAVSSIFIYKEDSPFAALIEKHQPSFEENIPLLPAITPHLKPQFFNPIISKHLLEGVHLPESGGAKSTNHCVIFPIGKTGQFTLAVDDLEIRQGVQRTLSSEHWVTHASSQTLNQVC